MLNFVMTEVESFKPFEFRIQVTTKEELQGLVRIFGAARNLTNSFTPDFDAVNAWYDAALEKLKDIEKSGHVRS